MMTLVTKVIVKLIILCMFFINSGDMRIICKFDSLIMLILENMMYLCLYKCMTYSYHGISPYKCMIYLGHFGAGDIEVKPRVSWVVPMLHIGRPIAICLGIPNRFDHVYAGG